MRACPAAKKRAEGLTVFADRFWLCRKGKCSRKPVVCAAKNATLARLRAEVSGGNVGTSACGRRRGAHRQPLFLVADGVRLFSGVTSVSRGGQPASAITNLAPVQPWAPYQELQLVGPCS